MHRPPPDKSQDDLARLISDYIRGDEPSGERLCRQLQPPIARAVDGMLGSDDLFRDDIIQDTQVGILAYLRKNRGFEGDLIQMSVTAARNRCRNLYRWRKRRPGASLDDFSEWSRDPAASPFDLILEQESSRLIQDVLVRLTDQCRDLLRSFYIEDEPLESIRHRFGLKSVQALFYRKKVCLESAFRVLKERL